MQPLNFVQDNSLISYTAMKKTNKDKVRASPAKALEPEIVLCHADRAGTIALIMVMVPIGIGYGFFPALMTKDNTAPAPVLAVIFSWCFASCIVFGTLACASYQWRSYLRADKDGLRERGWRGPERQLSWEEVDDYYSVLHQNNSSKSIIIGRDGTRFAINGQWAHSALMRKRVRERAINAKAHDWASRGCRPQDGWPRTFDYNSFGKRAAPWIVVPLTTIGTIVGSIATFRATLETVPSLGWGFCGTLTFLVATVAGGLSAALTYSAIPDRLTRARRHQKITLSKEGLVFSGDNATITADWEDITDGRRAYYTQSGTMRYFVQTIHGDFDFTSRLVDSDLLEKAIIYNAPRVKEWRLPEDDTALPVRHVTGSGVFVHHYRTQVNRLGIRAYWFVWGIFPLGTLLQTLMGLVPPPAIKPVLWWSGFLLPLLFWLMWRYFQARIDRDEDGLTFHTAFGTRHLLWSQITDFRLLYKSDLTPNGIFGVIESRAGRFVFFTGISERDRLFRAIESHLSPSTTAVRDAIDT